MTEVPGNRTMRKEQSMVISVFGRGRYYECSGSRFGPSPFLLNPSQENSFRWEEGASLQPSHRNQCSKVPKELSPRPLHVQFLYLWLQKLTNLLSPKLIVRIDMPCTRIFPVFWPPSRCFPINIPDDLVSNNNVHCTRIPMCEYWFAARLVMPFHEPVRIGRIFISAFVSFAQMSMEVLSVSNGPQYSPPGGRPLNNGPPTTFDMPWPEGGGMRCI
jgi:hypothetical protein